MSITSHSSARDSSDAGLDVGSSQVRVVLDSGINMEHMLQGQSAVGVGLDAVQILAAQTRVQLASL